MRCIYDANATVKRILVEGKNHRNGKNRVNYRRLLGRVCCTDGNDRRWEASVKREFSLRRVPEERGVERKGRNEYTWVSKRFGTDKGPAFVVPLATLLKLAPRKHLTAWRVAAGVLRYVSSHDRGTWYLSIYFFSARSYRRHRKSSVEFCRGHFTSLTLFNFTFIHFKPFNYDNR